MKGTSMLPEFYSLVYFIILRDNNVSQINAPLVYRLQLDLVPFFLKAGLFPANICLNPFKHTV